MATTTVIATYKLPDGSVAQGTVTFSLAVPAYHSGLGRIVTDDPMVATLDGSGQISIALEPTDSGSWSVANLSYLVVERIDGLQAGDGGARRYYIQVPTSGSAVDLGSLSTWATAPAINGNQDLATQWTAWQANAKTYDKLKLYNVKDYGAVGDGTTDDSAAFVAAQAAAYASRVLDTTVTNGASDRVVQSTIFIPAGRYKITTAEALIPSTQTQRTRGLRFIGDGQWASSIIFSPVSANKYLVNNNDCFQWLSFDDLTFVSTVSTASFMRSYSVGGPQAVTFNRCTWGGTWKYGVELVGTNTNSEFTWRDCSIRDAWTTFLFSAATESDQFVDYNFYNPNISMSSGDFIDMSKGGNINVWGGSLIHTGDGSAAQTFFNLRGQSHSYGVERLSCIGVRTEHRHAQSRLIYSEWGFGTISFISCDTGSQTGNGGAASQIIASFKSISVAMPAITFLGCALMGKHEYANQTNSWDYGHRVLYQSCTLTNASNADDFITFTDSTNVGGQPVVTFEGCYSMAGASRAQRLVDASVNWNRSNYGLPKRRAVSMKLPGGTSINTVSGARTVTLPLNAIITRIFAVKASGGTSTSTTWTYTFTDADAATVATLSAGGTTWNTAWNKDSGSLYNQCSTDNKRTITCTPANINEGSAALDMIIEYLG